MLERNKIYCMDCLEGMRQLEDKSIDLVLTDPPYGIGADSNAYDKGGNTGWREYKVRTDWDSSIPSKEVFDEMFRVSKNQIIWGGNYFTDYLKPSMGWLVWDKGQREFSLADGEMAWTSYNKAMRIFTYGRGAYHHDEERTHPTQKPIKLIRWCIERFGDGAELVLDPFLGSGTTAVACKQLGRDFIGFEINQEYVDIANKRLEQEVLKSWIN